MTFAERFSQLLQHLLRNLLQRRQSVWKALLWGAVTVVVIGFVAGPVSAGGLLSNHPPPTRPRQEQPPPPTPPPLPSQKKKPPALLEPPAPPPPPQNSPDLRE